MRLWGFRNVKICAVKELPSGGIEIKKELLAVRFVALRVSCPQRFCSSGDAKSLPQAGPGAGKLPGWG